MSKNIEVLDALELFHYSYQFENELFLFVIQDSNMLDSILMDLQILQASHIQVLLICNQDETLQHQLKKWNLRGCQFKYIDDLSHIFKTDQKIDASFFKRYIPVISLQTSLLILYNNFLFQKEWIQFLKDLKIKKIFFVQEQKGLEINHILQSHLSLQELKNIMDGQQKINFDIEQLEFYYDIGRNLNLDMILLKAKSGEIFQEIFTHKGSGTLITDQYPNEIRRAKISDIMELTFLMKPSITSGGMLPIHSEKIIQNIDLYFVYTVNHCIVASAGLVDYEIAYELTKFCTLPRYQGKGRAKELALHMIKIAQQKGKEFVFALSILKKMQDFFINLGFVSIAREKLPKKWQNQYDFSRDSKAFYYKL